MMNRSLLCMAALGLMLSACQKPTPEKPTQSATPVVQALSPDTPAPAAQVSTARLISDNDCAAFQEVATFDGWVVTIDDFLTSQINQSIDITFGIGQDASMEQVVQTSDPLYAKVAALRQGSSVRISGRFTHGNGECAFRLDKVGIELTSVG